MVREKDTLELCRASVIWDVSALTVADVLNGRLPRALTSAMGFYCDVSSNTVQDLVKFLVVWSKLGAKK